MDLTESLTLKKELSDFLNKISNKDLEGKGYDFLEQNLKLSSKGITQQDVEKTIYTRINGFKFDDKILGNYTLSGFKMNLLEDENSMKRLEAISGTAIEKISTEEFKKLSFELLRMKENDYSNIIISKNLDIHKHDAEPMYWLAQNTDWHAVINILQRNNDYQPIELKNKLLDADYPELGYFEDAFKMDFRYFTSSEFTDETFLRIIESYKREYGNYSEDNEKFLKTDEQLKSRHKISPPEHYLNIDLDESVPLEIRFNQDNNLIVLRQKKVTEEHRELILSIFDKNGRLLKETPSGVRGLFHGSPFGMDTFDGNIDIGSNNLIYINGGKTIFNSELEETVDKNFLKVKKQLVDKKILDSFSPYGYGNRIIFSVQEDNGTYYMITRPADSTNCYNNMLIVADEDNIKYKLDFTPTGGMSCGGDNPDAQLVLDTTSIYTMTDKNIRKINKDNPEIYSTLNLGKLTHGGIPCHICISPKGHIYSVSSFEEEEKVQSIKAHSPTGEFLTHIYPHNFPGGWAAFRSMSISKDGILAYTTAIGKNTGIDLYKLKE